MSLKLRELPHHVGEEVGLDEERRPLDFCLVGHPERGCEPPGQGSYPDHFVLQAPQPFVEHDGFKLFIERVEPCLPVLVEKEPGVGEAGPEHLFVPPYHLGGIDGKRVGKEDKGGDEGAVLPLQGYVALVSFHDIDEHRAGQLQIGRIVGAGEAVGIFRDVADLLQEVRIRYGQRAGLCLDAVYRRLHHLHPLRVVRDDVARPHLLQVAGDVRDDRIAGRQEPVPDRCVAARYPCGVEMDDLVAEQGDDPVDGPAEFEGAPLPSASSSGRGCGRWRREENRQALPGGCAFFDLFHTDQVGRLFPPDLQLGDVDALRPGEPQGRGQRLAVAVKGAVGGRAELYRDALLLLFLHVVDEHGQAPGRAEDPDVPAADAKGGEALFERLRQAVLRRA